MGKLLIKIPLLNLCKAYRHPFIYGHHLMFVCFNYKYTQKYVMSVCISATHVSYPWSFPTIVYTATDNKYFSMIGPSQNSSLKAKLGLQHTMVDA